MPKLQRIKRYREPSLGDKLITILSESKRPQGSIAVVDQNDLSCAVIIVPGMTGLVSNLATGNTIFGTCHAVIEKRCGDAPEGDVPEFGFLLSKTGAFVSLVTSGANVRFDVLSIPGVEDVFETGAELPKDQVPQTYDDLEPQKRELQD